MALESLPKIAPALFSAEQDLIQIYNKKSDTVGTINASYIGGSTPPSGVSGAIQFSNGSAFASDSANLFWDDANNRLGVGTNAPVSDITINSASGVPAITLQRNGVSKGSFYETSGGTQLQGAGNGLWLGANSRQDMVFTWDGNNYSQSTSFTFGANSSLSARVGIKGSGTTSGTTSLLVQNSVGSNAFQITDDRVISLIGGSTLKISSPLSSAAPIILSNNGAAGGYRGGYDFKSGANGSEGVTAFRITSGTTTGTLSYVGIGNLTESDVAGGTGKLQIENTISTGRNAAIKLRVNFADIANQYNGIQFDTIETGAGGAFIGSQRNTPGSGYGSDLVVLTTVESPANTYTETARFVGKSQSLSIGAGKNPTARLQVQGSGSTSATTSLLVQNSGGTNALQIRDDLVTNFEVPVSINGWNIISSDAKIGITPYSSGLGTLFNSTTTNGANYLPCTFWTSNFFIEGTGGTQIANATGSIDASAKLQVDSTTKGFLPPRMTDAQIRIIATPAEGLIAYNTDIDHLCCYQAGAWVKLLHSPM